MKPYYYLFAIALLSGCATKSQPEAPTQIVSMQVIDRNGFSETTSSTDRLAVFQKTDFLSPQPYKKVLRVFNKAKDGKSVSKITSYHDNGQIWQYLDVVDGRAHGTYREWHSNGCLKIEVKVIEGVADINEMAQASWVFEGTAKVFDEDGNLMAEIFYDKGVLDTPAIYYHPNQAIKQRIPYVKGEIDGLMEVFDEKGTLIEKANFQKGLREGISEGFWDNQKLKFQETYHKDLLQDAIYQDQKGEQIAKIRSGHGRQAVFQDGILQSMVDYRFGSPEGKVDLFDEDGNVHISYTIKDGKKNGEEWEYYPMSMTQGVQRPKLYLFWQDDQIQGVVKTWYDNGVMESQKEMNNNKKQGMSFSWYKDSSLMLIEEYDKDHLVKGSYYKKGEKNPVSKVENGNGMVSLFTGEGYFLKKITYEKGKPTHDPVP